jgi:hypothetical protein
MGMTGPKGYHARPESIGICGLGILCDEGCMAAMDKGRYSHAGTISYDPAMKSFTIDGAAIDPGNVFRVRLDSGMVHKGPGRRYEWHAYVFDGSVPKSNNIGPLVGKYVELHIPAWDSPPDGAGDTGGFEPWASGRLTYVPEIGFMVPRDSGNGSRTREPVEHGDMMALVGDEGPEGFFGVDLYHRGSGPGEAAESNDKGELKGSA